MASERYPSVELEGVDQRVLQRVVQMEAQNSNLKTKLISITRQLMNSIRQLKKSSAIIRRNVMMIRKLNHSATEYKFRSIKVSVLDQ